MQKHPILFLDSVENTNDHAHTLAGQGAAHGSVVCTDRQTRGRGRLGRQWITTPGNLFWSIIVRPSCLGGKPPSGENRKGASRPVHQPPPSRWAQLLHLPHIAALAVCDFLSQEGAENVQIKWPNDILLHRRKVAGILLESGHAAGEAKKSHPSHFPDWIVIGIGINLRTAPKQGVAFPATCLADWGITLPARDSGVKLRDAFCRRIDQWTSSRLSLPRDDIERRLAYRGQTILLRADAKKEPLSLLMMGIDERGFLKARAQDTVRYFHTGDLFPPPPGVDIGLNSRPHDEPNTPPNIGSGIGPNDEPNNRTNNTPDNRSNDEPDSGSNNTPGIGLDNKADSGSGRRKKAVQSNGV